MVTTLSEAQDAALQRQADARGTTPDDYLNSVLYAPLPKRSWTQEEDSYILNPANTPRAIAARFPHRSPHAISVRRTYLRQRMSAPDPSLVPVPTTPTPPVRKPTTAPPPPKLAEPPKIRLRTEPCPYCLPAKPDPTCRICLGTGSIDTMPES
jgi:hypothetical protein